jgi:tetratricopeptide (TPR) repeat protein
MGRFGWVVGIALAAAAGGCMTENDFDPGPPPPEIPDAYHRGVDRLDRGLYQEAIDDFTSALKTRPEWFSPYSMRGDAYLRIIDSPERRWSQAQYLEAAVIDFSNAIELRPSDAFAWYHRALAYIQMRKYDLAARDLLQLTTSVSPTDPDPEKILGFIYEENFQGMEREALEHYTAYYRKGGRDEEVLSRLRALESMVPAAPAPAAEGSPERERKAKELYGELGAATFSNNKEAQLLLLETLLKDYADTKFIAPMVQTLQQALETIRQP